MLFSDYKCNIKLAFYDMDTVSGVRVVCHVAVLRALSSSAIHLSTVPLETEHSLGGGNDMSTYPDVFATHMHN